MASEGLMQVEITIIEPETKGLQDQALWMQKRLPIDELKKLGITVGLAHYPAHDEYTPAADYQVLILPSGTMLRIACDEEDNGPGCIQVEK